MIAGEWLQFIGGYPTDLKISRMTGMKVLKRNMRNGIRLFLGWKMGFHALGPRFTNNKKI
jgi:hypothetical protein